MNSPPSSTPSISRPAIASILGPLAPPKQQHVLLAIAQVVVHPELAEAVLVRLAGQGDDLGRAVLARHVDRELQPVPSAESPHASSRSHSPPSVAATAPELLPAPGGYGAG